MTIPDGMDLVPPPALPDEWDLSYPLYGFQCDKWLDHPMPSGPDWFSSEERARRNANALAYRQKETKENWNRYLLLGFFVFADCFECDKLWAEMENDPLQVHRAIRYNFRFHVDQEIDIPPTLNAWAMNVSRVYLLHFDPITLHEADTLVYSWKKMPFMTRVDSDGDPSDWIPVAGRRRSKSPPKEGHGSDVSGPSKLSTEAPVSCTFKQSSKISEKQKIPQKLRTQHISWSQ